MMKVLIIGVEPFSLINFRGDLIKRLSEDGYSVTVVASCASQEDITAIERLGCKYRDIKINRTSISPISDFNLLINFILLIKISISCFP